MCAKTCCTRTKEWLALIQCTSGISHFKPLYFTVCSYSCFYVFFPYLYKAVGLNKKGKKKIWEWPPWSNDLYMYRKFVESRELFRGRVRSLTSPCLLSYTADTHWKWEHRNFHPFHHRERIDLISKCNLILLLFLTLISICSLIIIKLYFFNSKSVDISIILLNW